MRQQRHRAFVDYVEALPKPRLPRRPSFKRMIAQAEKAGMVVAGVTADGTVLFGRPTAALEVELTADDELARWRKRHAR